MTTTLESPDQLAAALDERGDVLSRQAASVIREQHLALEAACQMEQASAKRIGELIGLLGEAREVIRFVARKSDDLDVIIDKEHAARALLPKLNEALK